MSSPLPPALALRFRVEAVLADTPFERTFRAFDELLRRDVVLKLPARAAAAAWTAPVKERLLREARALARIRHAAVAGILHVEETPDGPLLVLEPPAGELLSDCLRQGPFDPARTIALGIRVGEALAHVHGEGVVHRAVGPSTIRVTAEGGAQLGAFTFAKEFGPTAHGTSIVRHDTNGGPIAPVTSPANASGPDYTAPEQLAGRAADPRADVWALGCTLFRCLAGRDPFPSGAGQERPPDLRALRPEVGRPLAEVVRKCMSFAKASRFATAQDVVDALKAIDPVVVAPPRRARWVATAIAAAGLGAVVWIARDSSAGPKSDRDVVHHDTPSDPSGREYGSGYDRVHGVFVAIGEGYAGTGWPELANPVAEVRAVIAQLCANDSRWLAAGAIKPLFDRDATESAIRGELARLVAEAKAEDAVLFYFAGHGAKRGDSFGLCAQDVRKDVVTGNGYLRREELTTFAKDCPAKHVLFVLDCCHSAAVFDDVPGGRGHDPEPVSGPGDHLTTRYSREFLCSAGAHQAASDGNVHSPFCEVLLEQLKQPACERTPYIGAAYLASDVAKAMDRQRARFQTPKYEQMGSTEGTFVFRLAPAVK